jgi:hypothetical protein
MKAFTISLLLALLLMWFSSCDPEVVVDYNIVNKTDGPVEIKFFGLQSSHLGVIQEDTTIRQNEKINIYRLGFLGSGYMNPADTITIFDSIQVISKNRKAKSDFKNLKTWNYSEKENKYGGGQYVYELLIQNQDF